MARIRYFLERGVFNSSSRSLDAIQLFLNACELGNQSSEDYYAVDAAYIWGLLNSGETYGMEFESARLCRKAS
ncbi:hypothetical protein [Peribacillus sp. NPDC096540]|uniref:hypothetical protein n=1 Tax=Peribacillus sp. NPDC096540 TaxID=3390612 RepID=UPI003D07E3C8